MFLTRLVKIMDELMSSRPLQPFPGHVKKLGGATGICNPDTREGGGSQGLCQPVWLSRKFQVQ